jgi:hypothetical protein
MKRTFTAFFTMLFAMSLMYAAGPKIIMISPDGNNGDDAQIAFLTRNGFEVEKFWPGALSEAGQDTIDMLNAADLVIIGRKTGSGDVDGNDKTPWNDLTVPLILNSPWGARGNKIGMINNKSATHGNTGPAMEYAQVLVPGDPIFAGVILDGDSLGWMLPPHDYVGGADSATNGTILARTGDHPLVVRWDADVAYFEGSGDTCRGPRVYFGFGNDDIAGDRGDDETPNLFPLTRAAKAVYLAEICRLTGIPVQEPVFGAEDVRVMMYTDFEADIEATGQMDDIEQTRWLVNQGFYVTKFWAGAELGEAGQDTLDKMNMSVDVVIAGRSNNSGGFDGISKPAWNGLTVPLIVNSQYAARGNRIGMVYSNSAFHGNEGPAVQYAQVLQPADPVFTGVALTGDSVGWMLAPHDYVGGLDSVTNGTILAGVPSQGSPLVIRWEAGTEYYPGAGEEATPAGPRYYFGFGNDNLRDNDYEKWTNDFSLTKAGKQAYLNAICLLGGVEVAQLPTAVTTAADAVVTFVTDYDADDESNGYWDDQVQIDWLMKNGVHVNVFYPGASMAEASQDTLDILNASELVIAGRSNNSGYFASPSDTIWNTLTVPVIINSPWAARSNKIGMINSTSAFHRNTEYALAYANVTDPDDELFTGVTLKGDSVAWTLAPHDFVGGLDSVTNGTIHAGSNLEHSPFIVTWEPGTEYFPGAGTAKTPAAKRAYVGFGNDNLRDNGPNYRPFDFSLTEDGQQVYLNVISMMLGAEMSTALTVTSEAALDSLLNNVEGAVMDPEFDEDSMEYILSLPEGVSAVTLDAYPSDIFAWTIGDTAVSDIMEPVEVEVHVIAENWNEVIYTVTINPFGTGIEERPAVASSLKVYPNPASNVLYLESDKELGRVTVFNVVGAVVIDRSGLRDNRVQLNLDKLTPGLYMVRVDNGEQSSITKVLKR